MMESGVVASVFQQRLHLPDNVLILVIHHAILNVVLPSGLELRLVSHFFDREVLHQLFDLFLINQKIMKNPSTRYSINHPTAERYWASFIKSRHPLRSFLGENFPSLYHEENYIPFVVKQSRRLKKLHKTLNDAIDDSVSELTSQKPRPSIKDCDYVGWTATAEDEHISCLIGLCRTAICLLGLESTWNFIHPCPPPWMFLPAYHSIRSTPFESFYSPRLVDKPSSFWRLLLMVYYEDIEQIQAFLDRIRVKHQNPDAWIRRLQRKYHTHSQHYSSDERRWLEALAASLTVAVSSESVKLVRFLLKQDPATSTTTFRSISFNESNLLDLAVQNCSTCIVDDLLEHDWLDGRWGTVLGNGMYKRAILLAARIPRGTPNRDQLVKFLLKTSYRTVLEYRSLLAWAATDNNMARADLLLSIEGHPNLFERAMTVPAFPGELSPLAIAAIEGNRDITRRFLEHAGRTNDPAIAPSRPYRDLKTAALKEMFRMNLYQPIDQNILTDLLESSRHQRLEQIQDMIDDPHYAIEFLRQLFEQMDVHSHTSDDTAGGTTLGEHALLYAVYSLEVSCTLYLLENKGVRISERKTVMDLGRASGVPPQLRSSSALEHEAEVDVRRLLAKYDMVASEDRTSIWPVPPVHRSP